MPPTIYELPVGYRDDAGRVHRRLAMRKMTGVEEELLYDASVNAGQLVSVLLSACISRLGDLEHVDPGVTRGMHVADRNFALLQLRRLSLGDQLTARYACPQCDTTFQAVEDLARIPVAQLEPDAELEDAVVELDDGYRDDDHVVHRRVVLGPPHGRDEEFVATFSTRDPLRAKDALVLRCIRSFGQLPDSALDGYGVEILRSLTVGDRRRMTHALNDLTLGPDFRRPARCPSCAAEFEALLDASSFFGDG